MWKIDFKTYRKKNTYIVLICLQPMLHGIITVAMQSCQNIGLEKTFYMTIFDRSYTKAFRAYFEPSVYRCGTNAVFVLESGLGRSVAIMSTALLAVIAVIICILFRILNVNSQPQRPSVWCFDRNFLDTILRISPLIEEP